MPTRSTLTVALVVLLAGAGGGCGTADSERDARRTVEAFFAALDDGDGPRACEQLSEPTASSLEDSAGRPCDEAVLELGLPGAGAGRASVWVTSAQVSLETGGVVFLDQTSTGWRISAAGCEAVPGMPYECELEA
jgi:hypothetical protein